MCKHSSLGWEVEWRKLGFQVLSTTSWKIRLSVMVMMMLNHVGLHFFRLMGWRSVKCGFSSWNERERRRKWVQGESQLPSIIPNKMSVRSLSLFLLQCMMYMNKEVRFMCHWSIFVLRCYVRAAFLLFICVTGKVRILKGKGTWGYEKNIKRKTEGILFLQRKTECCSEAIWQTEKFFLAWRLLLLDFFSFLASTKRLILIAVLWSELYFSCLGKRGREIRG